QFADGIEFRAGVAAVGSKLGEGRENVELSDGGSRVPQARGGGGDEGANIDKELALDFQNALVGSEDFALVFLEFGGSEALGVDECLHSGNRAPALYRY